MKDGEQVESFLGRPLAIVNKTNSNGENVENSTFVGKVLRSLTTKFNYVMCSTEESNDLNTLSIDELHGSLHVHEQMMQDSLKEEEHVLKVAQEDRPSRGRGQGAKGGKGRGRGRHPVNKAIIECFNYHTLGHY